MVGLQQALLQVDSVDETEQLGPAASGSASDQLEFAFCGLDSSVGLDVWREVFAPMEGEGSALVRLVAAFQLAYQGFPREPTKKYAPGSRLKDRPHEGRVYSSWEEIADIRKALPGGTPISFCLNETPDCGYVSKLLEGDRRMQGFIDDLVKDYGARHVQINLTSEGVPTAFFDMTDEGKATRAANVILGLCRGHPQTVFVVPSSEKANTMPFFRHLLGLNSDPKVQNLCGLFDNSAGAGAQPDKALPVPKDYEGLAYVGFRGGIDADNVKAWLDAYAVSAGDGGHTIISDAQSGFRQGRQRNNAIDKQALLALSKAVREWAADAAKLSKFSGEERKLLRTVRRPARKEVRVSGTIHEACREDRRVAQVHLSLKFEYELSLVGDLFWKKEPAADSVHDDWWDRANIQGEFDEHGDRIVAAKTKQGEVYSIIPYMITNAVETSQTDWYCEQKIKKRNGKESAWITERLSLCAKLATVAYDKYFPFELHVLVLKVQMNGTAKSSLVNLRPVSRDGIRCAFLKRATSPFKIDNAHTTQWRQWAESWLRWSLCEEDDELPEKLCRMYARDQRPRSQRAAGGAPKVETTMIASFVLEESSTWENAFKYAGVASFMFLLCTIMSFMDLGDLVQTGLAMVLADVGLLYVLAENDDYTPTEEIIVWQLMGLLCVTFAESVVAASYVHPFDDTRDKLADYYHKKWWCHCVSDPVATIIIAKSVWLFISAFKACHKLRLSIKSHLHAGRNDVADGGEDVGLWSEVVNDI